jgi:16S rRNA (cytosine1402-N4)-methyltransferase
MVMYEHVPVMCDAILTLLGPAFAVEDPVLVDATLGLGGHAEAALSRFDNLHLIGIDRDPQALTAARQRLAPFGDRLETHQDTYDQIGEILGELRPHGVLFDLGLSSLQIDARERGFAYAVDAPLSMRMDGDDSLLTAADVVNTYPVEDLARIFRVYGDEKFAGRIARAIGFERERQPFTSSGPLVATIQKVVGPMTAGHPAKRVFQALRMEVNDERRSLSEALPIGLDCLAVGGRMAVLSYHSGEDRLVKQVFAERTTDQVPPGLAVVPEGYKAEFRLVTRGAQKPSEEEVMSNPRSGSARLRVIERTIRRQS